ncbi:MAG: YigZ family protein [Bacteroidota bacterium]
MLDQYQTILEPSTGAFRDRGSKFVAYAFPVYREEEWQAHLEEVKKLHFKARHHCYAYRIGLDGNQFRANDDGEPSGTAGRPILGQIDSFGLTNVFVVVVRYFGGTKLGTSGLINAYRESTAEAFRRAKVIKKTVEDIYDIRFDYALMSGVMNAVKKAELEMIEQDFGDLARIAIAIRQSEVDQQLLQLKARIAKVSLEQAKTIKNIPGLKIAFSYTR